VETNDSDIIEEILSGKKERYAALMKKYNQRLYRISKGYLTDEAEIEDVMQDSYIRAFQNLSTFEGRSQFGTWITRIVINECLQRIKKKKQVIALDNELINVETMNLTDKKTPETESLNKELKGLLEASISQLPEKYRSIFIMREIEKMSIEETSRTLDITESNVKIRLNRAKEKLRDSLMTSYSLGSLYEFNLTRCDRIAEYVLARI
jgi:RNA polymerase sigma factor (sigma-70 family)